MFFLRNIFLPFLWLLYSPWLLLSSDLHESNPVRCRRIPNGLLFDVFHLQALARCSLVSPRLTSTSYTIRYPLYYFLLPCPVCLALFYSFLAICLSFLISYVSF